MGNQSPRNGGKVDTSGPARDLCGLVDATGQISRLSAILWVDGHCSFSFCRQYVLMRQTELNVD